MSGNPDFVQPFNYEQALLFDVPTITEEIDRLNNSLFHLKRTQEELKQYAENQEARDNVVENAINENQAISSASQEERIRVLERVLLEKAINAGAHYKPVYEFPNHDYMEGNSSDGIDL